MKLLRLPGPARTSPAIRPWLGVGLALTAVGLGALLGFAGPLIAVAALIAVAVALWALTNLDFGLWGVVGIITLLPFAALPFKVVFTPTFLDLALGGVILVYAMHWMTGRRRRLALTPAHGPLGLFMALAVFSFVAGMPNGPLTSNLLRQFGALLVNISLVFVLVDYLDSREKLASLVRVLLLGGAGAAVIGITLYFLPSDISERVLSALGVVGYPAGSVLRYVEDNPENAQRAIATSVDPNFLGGMLAMIGGLLAPQLLSNRPLLGGRRLTALAFAVVLACLILTFSRGAMTGLAVAVVVIAVLRHRRLLWVIGLAAAVVLVLPATRDYVIHFSNALRGADLATQMRFGEYKDALILIQRYPLLGVGFAGVPEIDIYLGVSSAYLLIAEQMGLIGLASFVFAMIVVLGWAWSSRHVILAESPAANLSPLWLGAHAGLLAALVVGVVDHYFFRLSFQSAGTMFWIFVALCLASTRLGREGLGRADPHPSSRANTSPAGTVPRGRPTPGLELRGPISDMQNGV
jgi:polysaccharide biosynthesis protein PslJ